MVKGLLLFLVSCKMKYFFMQNSPGQSCISIAHPLELKRFSNDLSWSKDLKLVLSISYLAVWLLQCTNVCLFVCLFVCYTQVCRYFLRQTYSRAQNVPSEVGRWSLQREQKKEQEFSENLHWLHQWNQDFNRYL